jgi:hypothetical protein
MSTFKIDAENNMTALDSPDCSMNTNDSRCTGSPLDAGVPGVAAVTATVPVFGTRRAQVLGERFRAVGNRETGDVFDALVSELPGNTKSKRSAEADRKLTPIHAVGDESLRMQRVGHVDAFPPVCGDQRSSSVARLNTIPDHGFQIPQT